VNGYLTTSEAAQQLGVSSSRVRQLVASGELPVTRFGPINMVKEEDLSLVKHRPPVGRPAKKKEASNK
jgi:excisionase family DNA binding protein